jgi:hypothetical protein
MHMEEKTGLINRKGTTIPIIINSLTLYQYFEVKYVDVVSELLLTGIAYWIISSHSYT